ncbi:MAG TPA: iron-containing alcohol dehydrogenase [Polyangiaceae bacterium]|nr:iron-containing alcohol dehydrogenase [Polyangiaceae bacterium]
MTAIWSFPTRVVFGAGESRRVGDEARALGMLRALIVADPGVERAGLCEPIAASLKAAGIEHAVYTGIDGNPTEANIEGGAHAYASFRADGVICIGGGSPMDAGKLVALRARCSLSFEELDDAIDGGRHIPPDLPPLITIPTTAGTGSEVGRSGVLTVRSTNRKTVIFSPALLAKLAILDPELTRSMPARTTAATGFDALTHCLEAYLAAGDHPMADAIACAGVELVAKNLATACEQGDDLEARGAMMKAAMMGAVAFQKGLGACHSLAHPLSSECGLHHGLANALCLPAVLEFNESAVPERVRRLAQLLGAEPEQDIAAVVRRFRSQVGLPSSLRQLGVAEAQLDTLADRAFEDACHRSNPRPCTRDDLLRLYQNSF